MISLHKKENDRLQSGHFGILSPLAHFLSFTSRSIRQLHSPMNGMKGHKIVSYHLQFPVAHAPVYRHCAGLFVNDASRGNLDGWCASHDTCMAWIARMTRLGKVYWTKFLGQLTFAPGWERNSTWADARIPFVSRLAFAPRFLFFCNNK